MDHDQLKDLVFEYQDKELPSEQHALVKIHLEACSECRTELQEWQRVSSTLLASTEILNTDSFVKRVMADLPATTQPGFLQRIPLWFRIPALAVASVALVFWIDPSLDSTVTIDSMLLNGAAESSWSTLVESPDAQSDAVMQILWEEKI